MKTYLITGGAGFIGSHLADRLLSEGNKVIVIDNFNDFYNPAIKRKNVYQHLNDKNYILYENDIRDKQAVNKIFSENSIDCVIHLAAYAGVRPSIENPILYEEVNCGGTINILENAKNYGVNKIVLASSSSVYGNCKSVPFRETDQVDFAISPYAATKKSNEVMGHVYHKLYKIDMAFLRFFTVYGPRQRPDLAINKFVRLMINNEAIPLFGDGTTKRDYTYVSDIVDGIMASINWVQNNTNVYEIFNLGNSNPVSLIDMIKTIEKKLEIHAIIDKLPMQKGDVDITYADISKANTILGYQPKVSFDEGIENFITWYKGENNE